MIITAKFASVCPCCSVRIAVGSQVEWIKGEKARHAACAATAQPAAQPAQRYVPTARSARYYGRDDAGRGSFGRSQDSEDFGNY
ncbi:MAG: hypothetical protein H0X39_18390 [Actinobacteria bacterium]|nr:hypothetical protein [Actinomycetota bacterium]